MTLGQAAGTAAALSLQQHLTPRALDPQGAARATDRRRRRSAPQRARACLIRDCSPRSTVVAIELADLGDWGTTNLVAEYDPSGPTIRVNERALPTGSSCIVREHLERAVAHELYHHREAIGDGRADLRPHGARAGRGCVCRRAAERYRMSIVAGIDAGQSSTRCVLVDADGSVLGRGSAGSGSARRRARRFAHLRGCVHRGRAACTGSGEFAARYDDRGNVRRSVRLR